MALSPWPADRIVGYLRKNAGRTLDPVLVERFCAHLPLFDEIRARFPQEEPTAAPARRG